MKTAPRICNRCCGPFIDRGGPSLECDCGKKVANTQASTAKSSANTIPTALAHEIVNFVLDRMRVSNKQPHDRLAEIRDYLELKGVAKGSHRSETQDPFLKL